MGSNGAIDAMAMMVENHFRHLPSRPRRESGAVVGVGLLRAGLLDIAAKFLYDARRVAAREAGEWQARDEATPTAR